MCTSSLVHLQQLFSLLNVASAPRQAHTHSHTHMHTHTHNSVSFPTPPLVSYWYRSHRTCHAQSKDALFQELHCLPFEGQTGHIHTHQHTLWFSEGFRHGTMGQRAHVFPAEVQLVLFQAPVRNQNAAEFNHTQKYTHTHTNTHNHTQPHTPTQPFLTSRRGARKARSVYQQEIGHTGQ